jgi:REP element-mobilizing transposase RayT
MPKAHTLFEITIRTIQGRFLLRPSKKLNDLILGVIGRALWMYPGIRIYAIKVASNHIHLIISSPDVRTLRKFMNHIDSNIAREAGRMHWWRDKFWSRRYRAIPILDDESLMRRMRYLFSHGCKEGLVTSPLEWPGVGCERALISKEALKGTWYDRTAMYEAERRGKECRLEDFAIEYDVPLTPLPCFEGLSEEEVIRVYRKMIEDIETEAKERISREGISPLGVDNVLSQNPHGSPCRASWCTTR